MQTFVHIFNSFLILLKPKKIIRKRVKILTKNRLNKSLNICRYDEMRFCCINQRISGKILGCINNRA